MIITTDLLSLKGGRVESFVGDARMAVPAIVSPTITLRRPIQILDAAPSDTEGVDYSFQFNLSSQIGASQALGSTNMGYLAAGVWEITASYHAAVDYNLTIATSPNVGMGFIKSPAVLVSRFLFQPLDTISPSSNYYQPAGRCQFVINLDAVAQVVAITPSTGIGQAAFVNATLIASRLL